MTLSLYDATVPVFQRSLGILATLLHKGEAHAAGGDAVELVTARLAPDMLPLAGQVQLASDTAKFAASRLTGTQAPSFADDETSFAALQERIAKTVGYLETVDRAQFEGAEARTISIGSGETARQLSGRDYVLQFALPNFFFHVTTAYDILRHNGVAIGKRDYLWPAN